jgi:PAS domain S-box-containing protein
MEESIVVGLIQNIAILLTFSMLYDYFWSRNENRKSIYFKISSGIVLGGIGIILILTPWHFIPGIFFDTRSVMLSISGLFFGPLATITAMIVTGLYRIYTGGGGVFMGVAVAVTSGTIGLLWRYFRPDWRKKNHVFELAAMGFVVHLVMLGCTFLLPIEIRTETTKNIALPVILIYPFATVLLGMLMLNQAKNWNTRQALNTSEKKFRKIIEQATDAMYISDLEGNIMDTNQQACKRMNYTREELLKLNITDLDAQTNESEKMKEIFEQINENESFTFESVHRRKNGETFPVEINSSLIDIDGTRYIIGFVRDITERKKAEQEIVRMGKHYQALIEKAPDGIVLLNAEGNFKFISPSALNMFGYSNNEEVTGNPSEYTHPDDLPMVLAALEGLIQNPAYIQTIKYRFIDRTGKWRWVESTFSNLLADPSVEAIVINFRDITDRKLNEEEISKLNEELEQKVMERTVELEKRSRQLLDNEVALLNLVEDLNLKSEELQRSTAQLEIANKELEAFSYSVSHDLRAPLRAISGFVSILLEDYEQVLDSEGKRICNIIHSNAIKMGQLIDDLLSFSRLIRSELHHSKIDMEGLVKNVISEFESAQNIDSKTILVQKLPQVVGDPNLMKQVWVNLLSNAIKYSSKNKDAQISIGSYPEQNQLVYYIKDNGVGFDMEYVHKLFGVFHRLHSIAEFEGTGVGLAIVQRIISRHRGRVWAEGKVGEGATFYFSLPVSSSK